MARTLSKDTVEQVKGSDDIVATLVRTCLNANLPISYAAAMLGVSRMTMHTWIHGGPMRYGRDVRILAFIQLIEDDIQAGVLPKKSLKETKEYAEAFAGKAISNVSKKSD